MLKARLDFEICPSRARLKTEDVASAVGSRLLYHSRIHCRYHLASTQDSQSLSLDDK